MNDLKTTIGLEIHVQLKTKSKMFCRCDNNAEGKKPNTTVCPICLGMPGSLPVTNKQAVLWTIKTGLALNCEIPKIAKFDRKHYFYPDLPKGYQISQYDEPFCVGGYLETDGAKVRFNRIHLEEDAGKLIHADGKSLVDLNRAGTPLMEMVTEPDITSPKQAGDFLRELQKIVRDVVGVSDANMEKGHLRCDANISVTDGEKMSEIVELKNINSFRFVEKALLIEEERLKAEYPDWPEKKGKVTRGYDSKKNTTYAQRTKEEAADYRYFPEPDLPPIDSAEFDLETLRSEINKSHEERLREYISMGIAEGDAGVLVSDAAKDKIFTAISKDITKGNEPLLARIIVHNYFGFNFEESDKAKAREYALAIDALALNKISKNVFTMVTAKIHQENISFDDAFSDFSGTGEKIDLDNVISVIISKNPNEVLSYKNGKKQLFGFFMGQVMKETGGKADPEAAGKILRDKLDQ
ncbi:MAG: Asp-tRNA(Asn)/Glu-tRNA(Gln) amidotransferase subunit GatB [Patescibacteria group bacterium]|nr:Asp-tRNA(Asn)/Glu-tRNA(Gln) amidotransferase subunit GatB [Patescibacteria group bacterium]